jgi:predicted GIY-YIG superfamily endonuclease
MFYVYILLLDNKRFYTGQTNNIIRRFEEHRKRKSISTRNAYFINLVCFKEVNSRNEAVYLEHYIKNIGAKKFIDSNKNDSLRSGWIFSEH